MITKATTMKHMTTKATAMKHMTTKVTIMKDTITDLLHYLILETWILTAKK